LSTLVFIYFGKIVLKIHQYTIVTLPSAYLNREVTLTVILPDAYDQGLEYKLLLLNDGQDIPALGLSEILDNLDSGLDAFIAVGIHANHDRIQEYGTVGQADYAGRGEKAGDTAMFVLHELIPFLAAQYIIGTKHVVYAGFSLGGLMALDIAWANPDVFSKAGVFSGALWWRQKALNAGYDENDRIMHARIRSQPYKPGMQFWFQCGTQDETDDRDADGVIDSIQDTLECVAELEKKGYCWNKEIRYYEVVGGQHNPHTWSRAMPDFLVWAFGKNKR
jgi:enterochelin esterase-like enzyme